MTIKCPNCGELFSLDQNTAYDVIKQIRDSEFNQDVESRVAEVFDNLNRKKELEIKECLSVQSEQDRVRYDRQIDALQKNHQKSLEALQQKYDQLQEANKQLSLDAEAVKNNGRIQMMEAVKSVNEEKSRLESEVISLKSQNEMQLEAQKKEYELLLNQRVESAKNQGKIHVLEAVEAVKEEKARLENEIISLKAQNQIQLEAQKNEYDVLLKQKDEQIGFYKDLKTKMSTKMVGETLEQHCETEFNRIRMTAFPNAYFEKDNDARSGSKGDYIYRELDENGVEILSIMFEMKNENDTTATKHKNEHFFKELDKDRREKKCEYAVLVSLLEADSELYNGGIVDVSYRYPKMYVVRPQCFLTIISILRNAALGALEYKQELALVRNQNIDISRFEENLLKFKDAFSKNYDLAHKHFATAVDEIDKTIDHLQKVKDYLLKSDNQYRLANDKADSITVKRLTKDNPTMKAMFEEAQQSAES